MKKFIVFLLISCFLFSVSLFKTNFDFSNMKNLEVQVFTSTKQNLLQSDLNVTNNGDGQIIKCSYDQYKTLIGVCKNISGVTYIFDGNINVYLDVLQKLNVKITEQTSNSFLGYSNNFSGSVSFSGKRVNVQGYINQGKIYIGMPLLLGSY